MKNFYYTIIVVFIVAACGRKMNEARPERKDIVETVFASGVLEPDHKYNLTAQTDGYLTELNFDNGDTVKSGQVLAVIDNRNNAIGAGTAEKLLGIAAANADPEGPSLKQAQQNADLLRIKMQQDSVQNERYKNLLATASVSKLEAENVRLAYLSSRTTYLNALENYKLMKQQTEQQLISQRSQRDISSVAGDYNSLKAVIGGRIYKRMKEKGDFVRRGDVIAVIGDPSVMFAKLSVDEANIGKIKTGNEAIVELNTERDKRYEGTVSEIYPAFDEATQSFFCKVKFKTRPALRISGTQLQANITVGEKKGVLVIPRTYLNYGNKVTVKEKGEVVVKTGFISDELVEIVQGLDEKDILLTDKLK